MAYDYTREVWSTTTTVAAGETAFRCSATTAAAKVSLFGKATSTTVMNAGSMMVSSGGTATSSFVNGGKMMIYGYGHAAYTTVNSGGTAWVYNKGAATQTTIADGGLFYVKSGGTVTDTTVEAGGKLHISAGGTMNGNSVIGGNVYLSGGILTGSVDLALASGYVYVKGAAELNFDVANDADGSTALVTRINQVKDTSSLLSYTITVNDGKQEGTYKLATVASGLAGKTITVKNTAGAGIGSFTVNDTAANSFETDKAIYSLSTVTSTSSVLKLTITAKGSAQATVTNGANLLTAIAADPLSLTVSLVGGEESTDVVTDAVSFNGIVTTINSGNFQGRVAGGLTGSANGVATSGTYSMTIAGGTFTSLVVGGDRLSGTTGTITHTGGINFTITGGTFDKAIGGGMIHDLTVTTKGIVTQTGDINLTISGGTFKHQVVGGNLSAKAAAAIATRSIINGNVNVTLDSSSGPLTFLKSVVGGSWGNGSISGSVNMTLTGSKAINIGDDLWGGCSSDKYATERADKGYRQFNTHISGDRTLTFSGFNATLTCDSIGGFNRLVTERASKVNLVKNASASSTLALGDIRNWELGYGSQIKGNFGNNFTNDTMSFGTAANASQMSGTWNVFNNTNSLAFVGFGSIHSVTLFGQNATYADGCWTSDDFKLSISDQYMTVTRLA